MTIQYGVTLTGFVRKTQPIIQAELEASFLAIDASLDLSPEQPLGQMIGILSVREAEQWELDETAYNSNDRNKAEFFLLDSIGALTGTPRLPATYSTVTLACTLTGGTTLTSGTTKANVSGRSTDTWTPVETFVAPSTGTHNVTFRATTLGPRTANATTITVINTPVSGWSAVNNIVAVEAGRDTETDGDYRLRQIEELSLGGSSTAPAIRAGILALAPEMNPIVTSPLEVAVFENTSQFVDGDGLPPHSVEVVVWDGYPTSGLSNDVIAQAMWNNKGGGVPYVCSGLGTNCSGTAVDSEGTSRTMAFTRALRKPLFINLNVVQDPDLPAVSVSDVKSRILAEANSRLKMGVDVVAIRYKAIALTSPGVLDIDDASYNQSFNMPSIGSSATLVVGNREIADLTSTSHMFVAV